VQAPISPLSVLGKALQSWGAQRRLDKLDEEEETLSKRRAQALAKAIAPEEYATKEGATVAAPGPDGAPMNIPVPTLEDSNEGKRSQIAELIGMGVGSDTFEKQALAKMGFGEAAEYDTTPRTGVNPATGERELFIMDKQGNQRWLGTAPETKMEIAGNNVVNPYTVQAGTRLPDTRSPEAEAQAIRIAGAGRPVTNVNMGQNGIDYGKPDEGLVWQRDPKTNQVVLDNRGAPVAIPYQGGKPYLQQSKEGAADANRKAQALLSSDVVVQDVTRLLDLSKNSNIAGMVGSALKDIPGTVQNDARALTDTIKANVAFDKLQRMREASPTGGALGSVSAPELNLLQSALGSLEQSQSREQYERNVKRVRDIYVDTVHGPGTAKRLFPDEPAKGTGRAGTSKGVSWRVVD